jgi:transposase-like protein
MRKKTATQCKFCQSDNIVKYGIRKNIQYYRCRDGGRIFSETDAPEGMRTPASEIATALALFYEGSSLSTIKTRIEDKFANTVDVSTIYRWIIKYTDKIISLTRDCKADASRTWVVYETVTDVIGVDYWIWDIFCQKTKFLLASHISHSRTPKDGELTINSAFDRASRRPDFVMLDSLLAYPRQVEWAFQAESMNVMVRTISNETDQDLTAPLSSALMQRTGILRKTRSLKSTGLIIDGFAAKYNFLTPQPSLNNKTPAEAAGIISPFNDWGELVQYQPKCNS